MAKVTQLRDVREWMGHRDSKTTGLYADYMPGKREADLIDMAFGQGAGAVDPAKSVAAP